MKLLLRFQKYMGNRKALLPSSLILSTISSIMGMMPFIFIWLIVRELMVIGSEPDTEKVIFYSWWAGGTALLATFLYFFALSLSHLAAFRVEVNMRKDAMRRILKLPIGFFDSNTSGRMRKIIDDNASITHTFLAHQMPDLFGSLLMPIATAVLIFFFDWRLGIACLIPIFTSMATMGFMMGKRGRNFMNSYMDSLEEMNTEAVEYVRGIPVVKVFQQTAFSFKNFYNSVQKYKDMVYKYTLMWEKPMTIYTVLIHSFAYILIPIGILLVNQGESLASILINLFLYVLVTPVFAQNIMKNMHLNQAVGQASEALNRLENLVDISPLEETKKPKSIAGHKIVFKNASFKYPGAKYKAVKNVSFTVKEGERVALVGASGGGKSTIAKLIPRFWDVNTGRVSIDGVDVKDINPKTLLSHVSFVFQNNKLFKASLLENIKYGNPSAKKDDIERAISLAQCKEVIDRLPDGLETIIGAEGTYLSGGEQQRIALARAFLKDAPIIVLDEATAFADPENEHLIQQALMDLTKGKTVLMIAHRLTSVVDVDNILVIDQGEIIEQGDHTSLLYRKGCYANMWKEYKKSVKWTLASEVCNA